MPTYVYEILDEQGQPIGQFEYMQRISDPPLTVHPESGLPVQRIIAAPFIGGQWSDAHMSKVSKDDKRLDKLGFTKYVKAGDGIYEKRAGNGPQVIDKNNPITPKDLKQYD